MMMIIEIDDFHPVNEQRHNLVFFLLLCEHNKSSSSSCIFYSRNFNQTKREKFDSINISVHQYWTFRLNRMTSVTDDEKKRFVIISYMFECGKY